MRHRHRLPQLHAAQPFLTDGGLETTLIFHRGVDLPCFAAFGLLADDGGRDELRRYFTPYLALAREHRVGFVLDTATWRANPDWGARLGYGPDDLDAANRSAVALAEELRAVGEAEATPVVINGVIGPRGDGYDPGELMSADEAQRYHERQIATFADSAADMVTRRHHDHSRRGDRHRPRCARACPAGGDLLHPGDRRAPSRRPLAARRHRSAWTPRPTARSPTT